MRPRNGRPFTADARTDLAVIVQFLFGLDYGPVTVAYSSQDTGDCTLLQEVDAFVGRAGARNSA